MVVIDPQNDVLSETGVSWCLVGESVKENDTVENLARLFAAAKQHDYGVFISPHYLYPHDQAWQFGGAVEKMMLESKEFFPPDPLGRDGFAGGRTHVEAFAVRAVLPKVARADRTLKRDQVLHAPCRPIC